MIDILVKRGEGTHCGERIVDPLITSVSVALARGKAELDERATAKQAITLEFPYQPGKLFMPGELVEVHYNLIGQSWRGKIITVRHLFNRPKVTTQLTIKKPTDFFLD